MAKGRQSDTGRRIQEVARELFIRQGIQQTSLRQIADRLGITKPALYYHFASREALVQSLIQPIIEEMEEFLAERERAAKIEPRRLLEDYFDISYRHRDVTVMLVNNLATLGHLDLQSRITDWRWRLVTLLVGPDAPLTARARAISAIGGMSDCVVVFADLPADELRPIAVATACAALGLPETPPLPITGG